ncbi:DUF4082 domain-containing protein [Arthrobacter pascens]|uniref:DUF4082 domain-containing protein n=1 Tax=Arthrobacter pascens TaxID=1677 RepID=UPI0027D8393C|nr:DUF4082 domain-containing protein [Arthrobacter pascens]
MSVNAGEALAFKIKTPSTSYRIDIYRLGYYQGLGARKVAANILPSVPLPQSQPNCATFSATGLIDCGNWAVSASWQVPASAVSGVYLALLVRNDTTAASAIPFVVRDDSAHSAMLFQTSDSTWQAYNSYGGNSLYQCTVACPPGSPQAYKGAFKVSYNRPFNSGADDLGRSWLMYTEYPMIRFMEANGYDVSYMSGLDVATKAPLLLNHKAFLSVGHDEYWSAEQRANVEAARDAGVNLAFFSGNEMFWKTRWESSAAGTTTPGRTLVSYKDTHFNAQVDPVSWTGTWRDPRYGTSSGGGNPENSLTGQFFLVNSGTTDIKVTSDFARLRLWRNTVVAGLANGATATLAPGVGVLGYEWDVDADNGFRPAGAFRLSQTTNSSAEVFTDYGSSTANNQSATHNLVMYKAASGALVFGAGTVQWSWGLDGFTTGKAVDKTMQQATVNLFADMGVQPPTLIAGLTAASASSDASRPTSSIVTPAPSSLVTDGTLVTVTGTAADTGGGAVASVEVSTDGGTTWRPATGTTNWTFSWTAHGSPTTTLRSRAVDDSGNMELPTAGNTVSVPCPCSIFGVSTVPAIPDANDGGSVEVGAKFYSDVAGTVTGVRYYKSTKNTGTHIGNVWSESGQRLATATFTGETSSGWQTVNFSPALTISAQTRYVVSYFAPAGHYAQFNGYFYNHPSPAPAGNGSTDSSPLHFTRSVPGSPNGFYRYGPSSGFPNQIYDAEYYWVDPIFSPASTAPLVASVSPVNNATGVDVAVKPTVTFNQGVTGSSVVFALKDAANTSVTGSVAYDSASRTATFAPASALASGTVYTATVSGATNAAGQAMTAPYSWSFTTVAPPTVASVSPVNNATGVDVAVKPTVTFNQGVTGSSVVFALKDAANTSVTGSVAYDSASRTATFAPASALASGTVYTATVSGATNAAGQPMTAPYSWSFTTGNTPLVASVSPVNNATGVDVAVKPTVTFNQGVTGSSVVFALKDAANTSVTGSVAYDSATWTATFAPASALASGTVYTATVSGATNAAGQPMTAPYSWSFTTVAPPTVASVSPVNNATGVDVAVKPTVTFSQPVLASSVVFALKDAANTSVTGSVAYDSAARTATFAPASALASGTVYTATVSGATNAAGQAMTAPYSWSFTTAPAPAICPCSVFRPTSAPATTSVNDGNAVELGMKFRSDVSGTVTAIRFYKGAGNTGTHVGHLWSSAGTLLSSVTFTGESSTGWQEATLASPVAITANTTYVVSYYAPNGFYSANGAYFNSSADNGPLHGLASGVDGSNGVYRYGSVTAFPSDSYNNTNYWVDVVLATSGSGTAPVVASVSPVNNATGVDVAVKPTVTFNQGVTGSSVVFALKDAANTSVTGSVAYDSAARTATFAPVSALASGTVYTATVSGATNAAGQAMTAPYSWSFTTAPAPAICPCSVFRPTSAPATTSVNDGNAVELGMKFRSDVSGTVTAIRFYKGAGNTGTHVGHLWSSAGTLLSSVTFTGESSTGWQEATLASPVAITANTTYVVSYYAPNGFYSANGAYFNSSADNGPLHGLASGVDGSNGVYRYGSGTAFPSDSYNNTNYWVDVVFKQ